MSPAEERSSTIIPPTLALYLLRLLPPHHRSHKITKEASSWVNPGLKLIKNSKVVIWNERTQDGPSFHEARSIRTESLLPCNFLLQSSYPEANLVDCPSCPYRVVTNAYLMSHPLPPLSVSCQCRNVTFTGRSFGRSETCEEEHIRKWETSAGCHAEASQPMESL